MTERAKPMSKKPSRLRGPKQRSGSKWRRAPKDEAEIPESAEKGERPAEPTMHSILHRMEGRGAGPGTYKVEDERARGKLGTKAKTME